MLKQASKQAKDNPAHLSDKSKIANFFKAYCVHFRMDVVRLFALS